MNNETVKICGSTIGMKGDLLMSSITVTLLMVIYASLAFLNRLLVSNYNITSFFDFLTEVKHARIIFVLCFIPVLKICILLLCLVLIFNTFKRFYDIKKIILLDIINKKITINSYTFPYNKFFQESKFDEITNINITQGYLHNFINTGNINIEFKIETQLKNIEIAFVENPHTIKKKIFKI